MQKKFSKDPKTVLVSIEEFLENHNYLEDAKKHLWKDERPEDCKYYYKFTSKYLIYISYGYTFGQFGTECKEKLEEIEIAFRNGKSEYELFDVKIEKLKDERSKYKRSKRLDEEIEKIEKLKKSTKRLFPQFDDSIQKKGTKSFRDYVVDTGYKTNLVFEKKYLVFDVETNGLRKSNDDLLSLSIYDPTSGLCYNRFFPLDLQPMVLNSYIHGITDVFLEKEVHMSQKEMDELIEFFDLKNAVLLSYSGGQGSFDPTFVTNYCKRHGINGFESLEFDNIKNYLPSPGFGMEGQMTKDNLCNLFGIDGVSDVHSSMNDCILQWKLFEKIYNKDLFFIDKDLYRYNEKYIIPVSYLSKYPELRKIANIKKLSIVGNVTPIYEYKIPKKILKDIKKFPTNINGISFENMLDSLLDVEKQNNIQYYANNKKYLEYVGSLNSKIVEMPISVQSDGTIKSLDSRFDECIAEVNSVTLLIKDNIGPVIDYIKQNIFENEKIMSKELVISDDKKVSAECDLSSKNSVLEIKTFGVLNDEGYLKDFVANQLFYQKKGRKLYLLSIEFKNHCSRNMDLILDDLVFTIYSVDLEEQEKIKKYVYVLDGKPLKVFNSIIDDPYTSKADLSKKLRINSFDIDKCIKFLVKSGFITKESRSRNAPWVILKTDLHFEVVWNNDDN